MYSAAVRSWPARQGRSGGIPAGSCGSRAGAGRDAGLQHLQQGSRQLTATASSHSSVCRMCGRLRKAAEPFRTCQGGTANLRFRAWGGGSRSRAGARRTATSPTHLTNDPCAGLSNKPTSNLNPAAARHGSRGYRSCGRHRSCGRWSGGAAPLWDVGARGTWWVGSANISWPLQQLAASKADGL